MEKPYRCQKEFSGIAHVYFYQQVISALSLYNLFA